MFTVDNLITDCKKAVAGGRTAQSEVRDILAKAVSAPSQVLNELGEPETGGVSKIYDSEELTIINVVWGPHMTIMPHNHEMWANIGIYTGREDNIFWRRVADAEDGYIEAAGAESLGLKDATTLGRDIIHSVTNPLSKLTGAIHIYGGDFFRVDRSDWDPESHTEQAYDMKKNLRLLEAAES
jgi:predicted metal-dependent enzyme (double-stranded beta helix superfamily)